MNKPQIRFKGFEEEWQKEKIGNILSIGNGCDYKHLPSGEIPVFGTGGLMTYVNDFLHDGETVFIGRKGTIDKPAYFNGKFWTVDTLFYTHSFRNSLPLYVFPLFQTIDWYLYNAASGVPSLSKDTIIDIDVTVSTDIKEQQKIGDYFKRIDEMIIEVEREINRLEKMKQASVQKMFPRPGASTPEIRFAGFTEPWVNFTLGNILGYIQPQPYIVKSSEYDERGVPVLTAGKSFILGYTNEQTGIFNSLPIILFDDFTTDKKFVNFPFKVKSSAAKILFLKADNFNINFVYQLMENIQFDASNHRRYWISDYSRMDICVPSLKEQNLIGEYFRNLDSLLSAKRQKLVKLRNIKQACLDKMFVNTEYI